MKDTIKQLAKIEKYVNEFAQIEYITLDLITCRYGSIPYLNKNFRKILQQALNSQKEELIKKLEGIRNPLTYNKVLEEAIKIIKQNN